MTEQMRREMTEKRNESRANVKLVLSLNIPLQKLFGWFRRLQLWATGDWQLHHDNMLAHASCLIQVFGETSNHPGNSAPLQPRFGVLWCLAFPKTKITFEMEGISDCWWDWRRYYWTAGGDWENCVKSQGVYFEGDWGIIVLCTMIFVCCVFFNKCLYLAWLDTF